MTQLALIFLGGGLGSVLRYAVGGWVHKLTGPGFPTGTLVVNVAGCAAIGCLATLFTGPVLIREEYRFAILVGLLDGFTTFSSFAWETLALTNAGQYFFAVLNIVLSNIVGLAAAWITHKLTLAWFGQ